MSSLKRPRLRLVVGIFEVDEQHSGHLHRVGQLLLAVVVFTTSHPLHSDAQTATAEEKNSTGGMEGEEGGGKGEIWAPAGSGAASRPARCHGERLADMFE